jgi:hypothetical protein
MVAGACVQGAVVASAVRCGPFAKIVRPLCGTPPPDTGAYQRHSANDSGPADPRRNRTLLLRGDLEVADVIDAHGENEGAQSGEHDPRNHQR